MLQPVGVVAVTSIGRAPGRLHVGSAQRFRPHRGEKGRSVKGAGTHLHVVRLHDDAALAGPVVLEAQDQVLEMQGFKPPDRSRPSGALYRLVPRATAVGDSQASP